MFLIKPWKKRDISDNGWVNLGDTPDSRRQRADGIEREIRQFWLVVITTALIIIITVIMSLIAKS